MDSEYLEGSKDRIWGPMNIMLVHTEFGTFHHAMNSTGGNTNVPVDANGLNVMSIRCERGSTEKDAVRVLPKTDRMLVPTTDSEAVNQLAV